MPKRPVFAFGTTQPFASAGARDEAEQRLKTAGQQNGMFLVRSKGDSDKEFVISFVHKQDTHHYLLNKQADGEFEIQEF